MIEMTLSSRHRIRNSSPGGLRPSTLPSVTEAPPISPLIDIFFPVVKWLDIQNLQLHEFCEASLMAYGTVIHIRGFVQGEDVMKGE